MFGGGFWLIMERTISYSEKGQCSGFPVYILYASFPRNNYYFLGYLVMHLACSQKDELKTYMTTSSLVV